MGYPDQITGRIDLPVAIVLLNRKAMLTRDQAVTEVLYPGEERTLGATMTPRGERPDQDRTTKA